MSNSRFPPGQTIVKETRASTSSDSGEIYEAIGPNGDSANLSTKRTDGLANNNLLTLEVRYADSAPSIRFSWTETKCSISRIGNETRFKNTELLDAAVADLVRVLVVLEPSLQQTPEPKNEKAFAPDHPVLKGIDLPPSLQSIVSVLLGTPYDKAHAATKRWMRQIEEKAQLLATSKGSAKAIVDGTILGTLDTSTDERMKNRSRLALVCSVDPKAAPRKRQLAALFGFENARPCTDKQILKFERLPSPNALTLVHDHCLRRHNRDKIEAAFRLSFKLEPGARNPILEADMKWVYSAQASEQRPKTQIIRYVSRFFTDIKEPEAPENPYLKSGAEITLLPSKLEGWHLRLTDCQPTPDIMLWAAALAPVNLAEGTPKYMRTGMGFMFLKFGDKKEFHIRPALIESSPSWPEEHVSELKRAIALVPSGSNDLKDSFLQKLSMHSA